MRISHAAQMCKYLGCTGFRRLFSFKLRCFYNSLLCSQAEPLQNWQIVVLLRSRSQHARRLKRFATAGFCNIRPAQSWSSCWYVRLQICCRDERQYGTIFGGSAAPRSRGCCLLSGGTSGEESYNNQAKIPRDHGWVARSTREHESAYDRIITMLISTNPEQLCSGFCR